MADAKRLLPLADGRFSGGTSGLSIGHISPEAGEGGAIGLIRDGDLIRIDIPARTMDVVLDKSELEQRRKDEDSRSDGWNPVRDRQVSKALKAYASMVSSADKGAIRII